MEKSQIIDGNDKIIGKMLTKYRSNFFKRTSFIKNF